MTEDTKTAMWSKKKKAAWERVRITMRDLNKMNERLEGIGSGEIPTPAATTRSLALAQGTVRQEMFAVTIALASLMQKFHAVEG